MHVCDQVLVSAKYQTINRACTLSTAAAPCTYVDRTLLCDAAVKQRLSGQQLAQRCSSQEKKGGPTSTRQSRNVSNSTQHMYTCTHTHTRARTHARTHVHTQTHTHTHKHTHTHTHVDIQSKSQAMGWLRCCCFGCFWAMSLTCKPVEESVLVPKDVAWSHDGGGGECSSHSLLAKGLGLQEARGRVLVRTQGGDVDEP